MYDNDVIVAFQCSSLTELAFHMACRFCMGSNKVLQVALGREESDEYKQNISELSNRIRGKIGLFFTKLPQNEVDNPCLHRFAVLVIQT